MKEIITEQVALAVQVLRKGGVILYPTDTVWGIGCDATNAAAVERIYALKQSAEKKSMLVLVASPEQAVRYTNHVPSVAWDLMEMTDKPLTLILPGAAGVADNLVPDEGTLGIRVPNDDFCQTLLRRFGRPVVSTSANITGEESPARFGDIAKEIFAGVDMVVDPACESREATHRPSSVIMIGSGGEIKIIRE
ncbi:threonylcarbamoyl-AMP synthase [Alistipes sp. OttesenSCG-928-B03]|nr:threonylcarbamoyl-AMP synthase [Alistipes sp. OttesenSCG-928-B03]